MAPYPPPREHTAQVWTCHRIDTPLDTLRWMRFAASSSRRVGRTAPKYCHRGTVRRFMERNHPRSAVLPRQFAAARPQNCRCHSPALGIETDHWILDVTFGEDVCKGTLSPCTCTIWHIYALPVNALNRAGSKQTKLRRSKRAAMDGALCCGCWQPHCPT